MCTLRDIRGAGGYKGDMVVIAHPELECYAPFVELCAELGVTALYWPFINVYAILHQVMSLNKIFQYQKLHIFNTYFRAWKKVLYIDAGTRVFHDINFYFGMSRPNVILAHTYSYPEYRVTLANSFNPKHLPEVYAELEKNIM